MPFSHVELCRLFVDGYSGGYTFPIGTNLSLETRQGLVTAIDQLLGMRGEKTQRPFVLYPRTESAYELYAQAGLSADAIRKRVLRRLESFHAAGAKLDLSPAPQVTDFPDFAVNRAQPPAGIDAEARFTMKYAIDEVQAYRSGISARLAPLSGDVSAHVHSLRHAHELARRIGDIRGMKQARIRLLQYDQFFTLQEILEREGDGRALLTLAKSAFARFLSTPPGKTRGVKVAQQAVEVLTRILGPEKPEANEFLRDIAALVTDGKFLAESGQVDDFRMLSLKALESTGESRGRWRIGDTSRFIRQSQDAEVKALLLENERKLNDSLRIDLSTSVISALSSVGARDRLREIGEGLISIGRSDIAVRYLAAAGDRAEVVARVSAALRKTRQGEWDGTWNDLTGFFEAMMRVGEEGRALALIQRLRDRGLLKVDEGAWIRLLRETREKVFGAATYFSETENGRYWRMQYESVSQRIAAGKIHLTELNDREVNRIRLDALDAVGAGDLHLAGKLYFEIADAPGLSRVAQGWLEKSEPTYAISAFIGSHLAK